MSSIIHGCLALFTYAVRGHIHYHHPSSSSHLFIPLMDLSRSAAAACLNSSIHPLPAGPWQALPSSWGRSIPLSGLHPPILRSEKARRCVPKNREKEKSRVALTYRRACRTGALSGSVRRWEDAERALTESGTERRGSRRLWAERRSGGTPMRSAVLATGGGMRRRRRRRSTRRLLWQSKRAGAQSASARKWKRRAAAGNHANEGVIHEETDTRGLLDSSARQRPNDTWDTGALKRIYKYLLCITVKKTATIF